MSDQTPQTQKVKKPKKANKSDAKVAVKLPFFNANPFLWEPVLGWHWDGYPSFKWSLPGYLMEFYRGYVGINHPGIHDWHLTLGEFVQNAERAKMYGSDSFFFHYWLSHLMEWQGYAIHNGVWNQTMTESRGTELAHPYGQRIEPDDAKRIRAADKAAHAAEIAWTARFA